MSNQSIEVKSDVTPSSAAKPWLMWTAFKRHCIWALPTGIAMAILGAGVVLIVDTPEYEATHILQSTDSYVLIRDVVDGRRELAKNELPLIMSPVVLDEVLDDPQFRSIPSHCEPATRERELRKRLRVSSCGTDSLLLITYRDSDKKQVAAVANAVAESYKREKLRFEQQRLANLERSLNLPMEQLRRNLSESRRTYEDLARKLVAKNPLAISRESKAEDESNRSESAGIETSELFFARQSLEEETAVFNKLNQRLLALRAEHAHDSCIISRSLAREPTAPIEELPLNRMLIAAGLVFVLPFVLAILIELRKSAASSK